MRGPAKIFFFSLLSLSLSLFFSCKKEALDASQLEVSGFIEAIKTDIRSQVTGEVKDIRFEEGQLVKKGDLLCILDDEKLTLQLGQIQAGLEGLQAKLRLYQKGTKKELIAVARNLMEAAEKELELAKINIERMTRLLEQGAIPKNQKEEADLRLKAAQENFENSEENYRLALRGREEEEIEIVEAEIKNLKAQEQLIRRQIQDTQVISPVNGFLETRHIEIGELAMPATMLFSLIDLEKTYVKAYVPEKYLGKVKIGTELEVVCDSYPDDVFKGKVDFISDQAEFAPKNIQTKEERLKLVFMVKSYLDNRERILKPGMPVDVFLKL